MNPFAHGSMVAMLVLAGCSAGEPANETATATINLVVPSDGAPAATSSGIVPIPPIPVALHGCWRLDDSDMPGRKAELQIDGVQIVETADWRKGSVTATADLVEQVSDTMIDGRFSAPEGDYRMTIATKLSLGTDTDRLLLAEGDAGSRWYSRCKN